MKTVLAIFLYILIQCAIASNAGSIYCVNESSVVYNFEGAPSVVATLLNCLRAVQDGLIAPYYDTKVRINVSTEVLLNNLISVNEVSSSVSLDLFFATSWVSCVASTVSSYCKVI